MKTYHMVSSRRQTQYAGGKTQEEMDRGKKKKKRNRAEIKYEC